MLNRKLVPRTDVDNLADGIVAVGESHQGADDITHIGETTTLDPVAMYGDVLVPECLIEKPGDRGAVVSGASLMIRACPRGSDA